MERLDVMSRPSWEIGPASWKIGRWPREHTGCAVMCVSGDEGGLGGGGVRRRERLTDTRSAINIDFYNGLFVQCGEIGFNLFRAPCGCVSIIRLCTD